MSEHPIENLMLTAMNSIKEMIDVNTIIGEPIDVSENTTIIPVSKVGFGFAAGGSEFKGETINEYSKNNDEEQIQYRLPFGGGAGAGVSISPVAFIVITQDNVKMMPVEHCSSIDKLLDNIPDLIDKINSYIEKTIQNKKEEKIVEEQRKKKQLENAEKVLNHKIKLDKPKTRK